MNFKLGKIYLLIEILFCVSVIDTQDLQTVKLHQINYPKINEYLEAALGTSADPEAYLDKVNNLLDTNEGSTLSKLVDSLKLFVSLKELTNQSTCNSRGYEILKQNNEALTDLARYGIRAIDRVALEFAQKHANICCSIYEDNFTLLLKGIDLIKFENVKKFVHRITDYALARNDYPLSFGAQKLNDVLKSSPVNYIRLMDDDLARKRNREAEAVVVYEFLKESSPDKLTGVSILELYKDKIEEPCRYYVDLIKSDVYQPAVMDEITRLDSRGKVTDCEAGTMDYRLGLAYNKVCESYVLEDNKLLADLLKVSK